MKSIRSIGMFMVGLLAVASCKGEVGGAAASSGTGLVDAAISPGSGGSAETGRNQSRPFADAGKAMTSNSAGAPARVDPSRPPLAGDADAGAVGDAGEGAADAAPPSLDAGMPHTVIVAVGYLSLRIMSKDRGRTWEHKVSDPDMGGDLDNPSLLRAVAYGNGLFVAAGHHIFTSPDGITWTQRENPQDQWIGGLQWGNGRFVAAGGYGDSWFSTDGMTWHEGGHRSSTDHARAVAFGNGEFRASTDDGTWWRSVDGTAWTEVSQGHDKRIGFCRGDFRDQSECGPAGGDGVFIEGGDWNDKVIRYSDDGTNWHNVSVDYVGSLTGIAFGSD